MLRNVCREGWTNILKERIEAVCNVLFNDNFVSINYEIWREFFFVVTFIELFVNGGPSLFHIWYIPVEYWFIVILFSSIYISLEDAIVILEGFFPSVSYIGESQFVSLRRLYILFLSLFEFMIPILTYGLFLCLYWFNLVFTGFRCFSLADNMIFSNRWYAIFWSVVSSFGKWIFLREISISL